MKIDTVTIKQPCNLELFAAILKVVADHGRKHKKEVEFRPQGKEVSIIVYNDPKPANTFVFGDQEDK